MVKKHIMDRSAKAVPLLSEADIAARLENARTHIEEDVERSIDDYIAHVNKELVPILLTTLKASGNAEEAYEVWKNFSRTGNQIALRNALREWNPPAAKMFNVINGMHRLEQKQDGHGRSLKKTAARTLRAGFRTAAARRASKAANSAPAKLNAQQEAIFEVFIYFWRMYQGPSAHIHPLRAAIAPHMKKAVGKKLLSSYEELKSQARKPLIDEKIIHSLREKVLQDSLARFDTLAHESYAPGQARVIPDYQFSAKQMPESTQFGIEIEGFSAIKQAFPKNLTALAHYLKEAGLEASAALKAKHTDYSDWTITYDNSIINPMEINGRYKTPHAITANSSSFELVSPILKGREGQAQLMTAINVLEHINFKSNDTCGLHMHVSLEETTLAQKKNLVKALYLNREALDGLVDPGRRGNKNKFALPIDNIDIGSVDGTQTTKELVEIINPGLNRNSKFDMTGLVGGGPPTIQYRCAGGPNYLSSTSDYAIILANFTKQALDNPDVRMADVISGLEAQRDRLALEKKPPHKAKPAATL